MRTRLKICTEADYLQAHLTFIEGESQWNPAFRNVKQRATSILKKWIAAANIGSLARRGEKLTQG